ncbi:MAG: DUF4423 domain-containing protein [Cryobacterium sp.]|nr:DUF4423 domain-containing protein [Oligoflexia bacterium]
MMEKTVFQHTDYKIYLKQCLSSRPRGEQGRLAGKIRCHSGYVSQVLQGDAHFSAEQAIDINLFLNHSKAASTYFLLLIQHARAGTSALRAHIAEQMHVVLENQLVLKNRFPAAAIVSESDQAIIYGSWHFVAVHMAVLVPRLRKVTAIAEYLGIPLPRVKEVVEVLIRAGLVRDEGSRLSIGKSTVHLSHDSPFIARHHTNWRIKALESLDCKTLNDVHYSSVVTIAKADAPKVREILVRAIEEVRRTVKPSADEALYCYGIDWFKVGAEKK